MAEPFQIEIAVLNCFRRRSFHELNLRYQVRLMKRSASETGLSGMNRQNVQVYDDLISL